MKTQIDYFDRYLDCGDCSDTLPAGWNSTLCGDCSSSELVNPYSCQVFTFEHYSYCFENDDFYQMASQEKISNYCRCSCDSCGNEICSLT